MALLTWSDDYKVNIRVIDNEHRALFDMVNAIDDAVQKGDAEAAIAAGLKALLRYAHEHFPDEERFIAQSGYPKLAQHKAEHDKFTHAINRYKDQFENTPDRFDSAAFLKYLAGWISGHVLHADKDIAPYLRGEL